MDKQILDLKNKINDIKQSFSSTGEDSSISSEICPDEVESEIAMLEIMRNVYLECLVDEESEGDA
jgi:hypothetical protein